MSRDTFKLSNGNLKVLETIPKMMEERRWRKKIRMIVLDYLIDESIKEE